MLGKNFLQEVDALFVFSSLSLDVLGDVLCLSIISLESELIQSLIRGASGYQAITLSILPSLSGACFSHLFHSRHEEENTFDRICPNSIQTLETTSLNWVYPCETLLL